MSEIKKVMEEIECMIKEKDICILQQEDEIQSLKKATKECYNEGLSDGMNGLESCSEDCSS